jgi:hypothetical protein
LYRGISQRHDFGVCSRIVIEFPTVAPPSKKLSVCSHDDAADGHVAGNRCPISFLEREAHPLFVGGWGYKSRTRCH